MRARNALLWRAGDGHQPHRLAGRAHPRERAAGRELEPGPRAGRCRAAPTPEHMHPPPHPSTSPSFPTRARLPAARCNACDAMRSDATRQARARCSPWCPRRSSRRCSASRASRCCWATSRRRGHRTPCVRARVVAVAGLTPPPWRLGLAPRRDSHRPSPAWAQAWRDLPTKDFAVVTLHIGFTVAFGMTAAVALGLMLTAALFIVEYSTTSGAIAQHGAAWKLRWRDGHSTPRERHALPCGAGVLHVSTGQLERSMVVRTAAATALLDAHGAAVLVVHLHGPPHSIASHRIAIALHSIAPHRTASHTASHSIAQHRAARHATRGRWQAPPPPTPQHPCGRQATSSSARSPACSTGCASTSLPSPRCPRPPTSWACCSTLTGAPSPSPPLLHRPLSLRPRPLLPRPLSSRALPHRAHPPRAQLLGDGRDGGDGPAGHAPRGAALRLARRRGDGTRDAHAAREVGQGRGRSIAHRVAHSTA